MKNITLKIVSLLCLSLFTTTTASAVIAPPPPTPTLPTTKEECKKDGWQSFGGIFKNQGDCVSFVVTGGNNPPANL